MKKIWVGLVLSLICSISLFASILDTMGKKEETILPKQKSIFLSYETLPKQVYLGEVFPVKIKAIIATKNYEDLSQEFLDYNETNITIINPESKWQWYSDNIFYNTFFFKVKNAETTLPTLKFNLINNNTIVESEKLSGKKLNTITLNADKYFSQVIAKSLKIEKYKTTYFDDSNYIIVLEIEANESNLEDFSLQWVEKDGIDSKQEQIPFTKIFYYAIIPDYTKTFTFTYFDKALNNFKKISLPIIVNDDKVSTQLDLNPKESSLQIYKYFFFGFLAIIFFTLFFKRRKKIYIVLLLLSVLGGTYDLLPLNNIKIKENTHMRILPTKNSTIFYTIDRPIYAERLAKREKYIKILLPNGKIGWIKEDSVIKN